MPGAVHALTHRAWLHFLGMICDIWQAVKLASARGSISTNRQDQSVHDEFKVQTTEGRKVEENDWPSVRHAATLPTAKRVRSSRLVLWTAPARITPFMRSFSVHHRSGSTSWRRCASPVSLASRSSTACQRRWRCRPFSSAIPVKQDCSHFRCSPGRLADGARHALHQVRRLQAKLKDSSSSTAAGGQARPGMPLP